MEIEREIAEIQSKLRTVLEIQAKHEEMLRAQQAIEPQKEALNRSLAKLPDNATLACAFYATARAEILQRLSMRETTFTFWVATVGVVVSLSVKAASQGAGLPTLDTRTLGLIPVMSLPFTLLVTRHSMIIGGFPNTFVTNSIDFFGRAPAAASMRRMPVPGTGTIPASSIAGSDGFSFTSLWPTISSWWHQLLPSNSTRLSPITQWWPIRILGEDSPAPYSPCSFACGGSWWIYVRRNR